MRLPIEDYALIGNTLTAALVGKNGSIDWLCWPRFDSDACFAALLGTDDHGHWRLAPEEAPRSVSRRYRPRTLILDTDFEVDGGAVRVTDFMSCGEHNLIRLVTGLRGSVTMQLELALRFGYGDRTPWMERSSSGYRALAGPDSVTLSSTAPLQMVAPGTIGAHFTVDQGMQVAFQIEWFPSHQAVEPTPLAATQALEKAAAWWASWSAHCCYEGPWADQVLRSLITLKALTYSPTGGIVAAPTTSLPERLGGVRNWDYRFCWLRDATFTLLALMNAGYHEEARAWRDWLVRAVAGEPDELVIAYGIAGERRLPELSLPWLPGYEGSRPVRIGNRAAEQFQLDIYGEVMDCLHHARGRESDLREGFWEIQRAMLDFLESNWGRPDEGIWEVRGPSRHFTHSKVMAWVALDRAIKDARRFRFTAPIARWRAVAAQIHAEVCAQGYDAETKSFVQSYGSKGIDASLLMIPLVGFLPVSDPRVAGTHAAITQRLMKDGLVYRYDSHLQNDGLPPGEGAFLACSFWYVDNLVLLGRQEEALQMFERLLALTNDVGLLSEEYDPASRRMLGNFPQAFSHVALVNTALNLSREKGPAEQRPHQ
jgi:GH15 family glucan-1,4-alpha-glucosidase